MSVARKIRDRLDYAASWKALIRSVALNLNSFYRMVKIELRLLSRFDG